MKSDRVGGELREKIKKIMRQVTCDVWRVMRCRAQSRTQARILDQENLGCRRKRCRRYRSATAVQNRNRRAAVLCKTKKANEVRAARANKIKPNKTSWIYDTGFTIYEAGLEKDPTGTRGSHPPLRLSPRAAGREGTEPQVMWMNLSLASSNLQFEEKPMKTQKLNQIKPD
jgi:hypothetical protein